MNWTIGFITNGTQDPILSLALQSVRRECPDAQLVVVGGPGYDVDLHIPFEESSRGGWITAKKNLIARHADHENIAILHDYIELMPGWNKGVTEFGDDWFTCMHRVLNSDGQRYRDWCVIYNDAWMEPPIDDVPPPTNMGPGRMLDYGSRGHERWQYYSGSYFCTKKSVMLETPLDETRFQGGGEDVQWCRLLYQKYGSDAFTMNTNASVRLLKYKTPVGWQGLPCI